VDFFRQTSIVDESSHPTSWRRLNRFSPGNVIFTLLVENDSFGAPVELVFSVGETGRTDVYGTLDLHGNPVINQGGVVDANLQAAIELASAQIARFEQGDVLCWVAERLEKCDLVADVRVVAVASTNGKLLIMGVQPVKVIGPIEVSDLLVTSDVAGYATVGEDVRPGTVIAKALEASAGDAGLIKALILSR
jgi:hypothetical protein